MSRRLIHLLAMLALVLGMPSAALAQSGGPGVPTPDASALVTNGGRVTTANIAPVLQKASGQVQLVVRLAADPLARAVGENAKGLGSIMAAEQQVSVLAQIDQQQNDVMGQIEGMGGKQLGRVRKALNAVMVQVDAKHIQEIAALPGVVSIHPVINYQLDLSETVPYIGASALQAKGVDGTGVRVAVLDTGIDYTHYNLGGSGDVAEFDANNPSVIEPGTFPTWKVIGGYDFVGELWDGTAGSPLIPDPDPLDKGPAAGHGTHVADIIAGKSKDGKHVGVAPGASLYAVGVCAKTVNSCPGVAILEGMDFALDPNGDGRIDDAVDVINLSLGSSYGQFEDDLSVAAANAVHMGVVVVASAGNSGDKPYIVGSPSSQSEVISVAQTQVPSAKVDLIKAGSVTASGSWQTWSPAPTKVSGPLQYGDGAGGNLDACTDFAPGVLQGKVALIDRGNCAISLKSAAASAAGAIAVIVANNVPQAPGDLPPDFSYGGGDVTVATYSITMADGDALKTVLGQTATIDPANAVPLIHNTVSTSSRGPNYSFNAIKPDIAAPGASVSAVYGTGTGQEAFGGTSGAAPMVSGSAALILQACKCASPTEVKARLMNTGDTDIGINPVSLPGQLAPVTRIGGGEVRVNKAVETTTVAWDAKDLTGSLSFGYDPIVSKETHKKEVVVHNYSSKSRTYQVTPTFRYADDAASGAVQIRAPKTITVPARGEAKFTVELRVDPNKLPIWKLNGGELGGDAYRLQSVEFDGYIYIKDAKDDIHLAWQILPHRSASIYPASRTVKLRDGVGTLELKNTSQVLDGLVEAFSLLGQSGRIPDSQLPKPGDNFAIIDLRAFGARLVDIGNGEYGIQFAINTYGIRAHPNYPAEFDVYIDSNRDGTPDYVILNIENGGFGATGQNVVAVFDMAAGSATIYFYTDADLNSANVILTAPLAALGLTPDSTFDISVQACDNYFTGICTDQITGMTYTAGLPRYVATGVPQTGVPAGSTSQLKITELPGGAKASPSQRGILLFFRDARPDMEAVPIIVNP